MKRIKVLGKIKARKNELACRVYDIDGLAPCLNARMGTGGGNVPLIVTINEDNTNTNGLKKMKNIVEMQKTGSALTINGKNTKYRIRRLTERECLRLMDVKDEDIDKILSTVSSTQAYKLAGNSIVVSCLYHIFRKMFTETEFESTDGQLSLF